MKVVLATTLGYCNGVKRAVELAYDEVNRIGGNNVLMEGQVIHNRVVVEDLKSKGVELLGSGKEISGKSVVVRAHGVTPAVEKDIKTNGGKLVDGTCPIVKASQKKILKYVDMGYDVVITGDKGHPEVIGLIGQAPDRVKTVSSVDEVKKLTLPEKTLLISQTTFSKEEFYIIEEEIKKICPTLKSICTICNATKIRQDAVRELSRDVEAIVVVGGLNSSNTKRLKEIGLEKVPTWLVETYKDIPDEIKDFSVVGISAGASTPNFLIDEVVNYLSDL